VKLVRKRCLIFVLLLSIVIVLSGCLTPSPPGGEGNESVDDGTGDVAEGELPSQYHYVMEFSSSEGDTGRMEAWAEGEYSRFDIETEGEITTFLSTPEETCLYDSSSGYAMKFPREEGDTANPAAAYGMWFGSYYYGEKAADSDILAAMQDMCSVNPTCDSVKKVGSETVAGHKCIVIETVYKEEMGAASVKMWFASGYGYLMKLEVTDPDGTVTTMEFTEVDIEKDIPDSVFSIPECENAQSMEEMFGEMEGFEG